MDDLPSHVAREVERPPHAAREVELPSFETCEQAVKEGHATALQVFIEENEPANYIIATLWRNELAAAVASFQPREDALELCITVSELKALPRVTEWDGSRWIAEEAIEDLLRTKVSPRAKAA